jgi:hypothetical protein
VTQRARCRECLGQHCCSVVATQIRRARQRSPRVSDEQLADWERRLRLALEIDRKDSVPVDVPYPSVER